MNTVRTWRKYAHGTDHPPFLVTIHEDDRVHRPPKQLLLLAMTSITSSSSTKIDFRAQALAAHSTQSGVNPLWEPPNPESTHTFALLRTLNAKYALNPSLSTYEDLWRFSVTRQSDFWATVWDVSGVIGTRGKHVVDERCSPADNPDWFKDEETKLSWAENMLRWKEGEEGKRIALIQVGTLDELLERSLAVTKTALDLS